MVKSRMATIQEPTTDYSKAGNENLSQLKYIKKALYNGAATYTISSTAGTNTLKFLIESRQVINLSRSILNFTATTAGTTGKYNYSQAGVPFFSRLKVSFQNGTTLADITDFDKVCRYFIEPEHDMSFVQTLGSNFNRKTGDGAARTAAGANTHVANVFDEMSLNDSTAAAEASVNSYRIPLNYFTNTILAVDKLLYTGESLYIELVLNDRDHVAFYSDSATDITANAASKDTVLSDISLALAVESNPDYVTKVTDACIAGDVSLDFPVWNTYSQVYAATSGTVFYQFGTTQFNILKDYYVVFELASGAKNTAYKVEKPATQYTINLNGRNMNDYATLVGTNAEYPDWLWGRMEQLKGKMAGAAVDALLRRFYLRQTFRRLLDADTSVLDGYPVDPLGITIQLSWIGTTANDVVFQALVGLRTLKYEPGGFAIVK